MTTYPEDREPILETELGDRVAAEVIGQNDPGDQNPYTPSPMDWIRGLIYFANPGDPTSRAWMRENGWAK